MSKVSQISHLLNHCVAHKVQKPQTKGQHPVEMLWKFNHSLTGQLRGSSMRSSSMTGWISQLWSWKTWTSIEEQTCRRRINVQKTSWSRISEIGRGSRVFQEYFWDPTSSKGLWGFSLIFFNLSVQRGKTWSWSSALENFHFSSCVRKTPEWTCYQRTTWVKPEDKISLMLMWPAKMKKDEAEDRNFRIWMHQKQVKSGMLHRKQPTKGYFHSVITWQHYCVLLEVISANLRQNDLRVPFLSTELMSLLTHFQKIRSSICGIVLYAEKFSGWSFTPSERLRRQNAQNIHRWRFLWRWIWTVGRRRSNLRTR